MRKTIKGQRQEATMNVETYDLADISERFIALIIDVVILGMIGGILGVSVDLLWGGGLVGFIISAGYQWYFLTHQDRWHAN
jgi:hypothetical protein